MWPYSAQSRTRCSSGSSTAWTRNWDRCWSLLQPQGLLLVTAFSVQDPGYATWKATARRLGHHIYRNADGELRSWLTHAEFTRLFDDMDVLSNEEAWGPWHRHGEGAPERHMVLSGVFRQGLASTRS